MWQKAISNAIVFISIRAASSQQNTRVPNMMVQFVLKIAQFISWGLGDYLAHQNVTLLRSPSPIMASALFQL